MYCIEQKNVENAFLWKNENVYTSLLQLRGIVVHGDEGFALLVSLVTAAGSRVA